MSTISKQERSQLMRQANASRALYRSVVALAPALLFVVVVVVGFAVLGG